MKFGANSRNMLRLRDRSVCLRWPPKKEFSDWLSSLSFVDQRNYAKLKSAKFHSFCFLAAAISWPSTSKENAKRPSPSPWWSVEEGKANPLPNLLCQQNEDGKPDKQNSCKNCHCRNFPPQVLCFKLASQIRNACDPEYLTAKT